MSRPPALRNTTLGNALDSTKHTIKWSMLSVVVGITVGFAAVAFTGSLNWGIAQLVGLRTTTWLYFLPVLGLFLSGYFTSKFAPEAAGHGTDAVIRAYNQQWGRTDLAAIPIKLIASVVTIASGGSAGREGPTVQMGGGLGYLIGRTLGLDVYDMRRVVVCGMGASFGAIFTAPIAGGIFGTEAMYRDDLQYTDLFASFLSSITAYYFYSVVLGKDRLFNMTTPVAYEFSPARDIVKFIVLGVLVGIISMFFIKGLYGYEHLSNKLPLAPYFRTALGGLLTALTAVAVSPMILGTGMSIIEKLTWPDGFTTAAMASLLIGKIAATSFTIGSGGSGGVVAPSLSTGALTGALFAKVVGHPYPVAIIAACAVGLLGSAAHLPITTTILAAELFGLDLLLPATIISFVGSWIARGDTLYRESHISKLEQSKVTYHFE